MVFSSFYPFLVIFVTGGVLLELQANLLGLLSFSRVTIPEASGDGRWTWMILWTQQSAIPIVCSYFSFTVLEFLACEDAEVGGWVGVREQRVSGQDCACAGWLADWLADWLAAGWLADGLTG